VPGGALRRRQTVRDSVYRFRLARFPGSSCFGLNGSSEGRYKRDTNHVCSLPRTTCVVGEVVWSLSPYLSFTEKCRPDSFGGILMPGTSNLNFPGSSPVAGRSLTVCVARGRLRNREKASQTWMVDGRLLMSLFQHSSRNSQTGFAIPLEGR